MAMIDHCLATRRQSIQIRQLYCTFFTRLNERQLDEVSSGYPSTFRLVEHRVERWSCLLKSAKEKKRSIRSRHPSRSIPGEFNSPIVSKLILWR